MIFLLIREKTPLHCNLHPPVQMHYTVAFLDSIVASGRITGNRFHSQLGDAGQLTSIHLYLIFHLQNKRATSTDF